MAFADNGWTSEQLLTYSYERLLQILEKSYPSLTMNDHPIFRVTADIKSRDGSLVISKIIPYQAFFKDPPYISHPCRLKLVKA